MRHRRVIRAGGALGNYDGGIEMKRWSLTLEGALGAAVRD
jgi:O6-methylguanine-DNA--protein-cysteine methyltransferase